MKRATVTALLFFPFIPAGSFIGRDVAFEGAELGDSLDITEPWQRPAGVEFSAYVPLPGTVRVLAKNRTNDPVSIPEASYGLSIGTGPTTMKDINVRYSNLSTPTGQ